MTLNKLIALIPARQGSERVKDKNIKQLNGHPLIAYSICSAVDAGIFDKILVSTDSKKYADISRHYGAEVPFLRPKKISRKFSPDYDWIRFTLDKLKKKYGQTYNIFFLLRPTSPLRTAKTILKAWKEFQKFKDITSLRAVELCSQHPGKMWKIVNKKIKPIMKGKIKKIPFNSSSYQSLPKIYIQNASLEITKVKVIYNKKNKSITGNNIYPFKTRGYEGYDINKKIDLKILQKNILNNQSKLSKINKPPYKI